MCIGISNPDDPRYGCDCHLTMDCKCNWDEGEYCEKCEESFWEEFFDLEPEVENDYEDWYPEEE